MREALLSGVTALAFHGVGRFKTGVLGFPKEYAEYELKHAVVSAGLHGLVGGTVSVARGGKFGSGFLSAGFSDLATPYTAVFGKGQIVAVAVVGGTTSVLGGGKFANGAVTAAFGYLYNHIVDATVDEYLGAMKASCDRIGSGQYTCAGGVPAAIGTFAALTDQVILDSDVPTERGLGAITGRLKDNSGVATMYMSSGSVAQDVASQLTIEVRRPLAIVDRRLKFRFVDSCPQLCPVELPSPNKANNGY